MTKLKMSAAIAAIAALTTAQAIAQETTTPTSDPFVSTQEGEGLGLSGAAVGGLSLVIIGGIIALVDSDGNVVATTSAP